MPSKKIKPLPEIVFIVKYMCGNTSQGTTLVNDCYLFEQSVAQKAECYMVVTLSHCTAKNEFQT